MENNEQKMRTVLLAAPSHDGTVNVWHAAALAETCKIGLTKNINVIPVYMSYDALVQRSRNDLVRIAVESNCDGMLWIDGDMEWDPDWAIQAVKSRKDVLGLPVIKKSIDNIGIIDKSGNKNKFEQSTTIPTVTGKTLDEISESDDWNELTTKQQLYD